MKNQSISSIQNSRRNHKSIRKTQKHETKQRKWLTRNEGGSLNFFLNFLGNCCRCNRTLKQCCLMLVNILNMYGYRLFYSFKTITFKFHGFCIIYFINSWNIYLCYCNFFRCYVAFFMRLFQYSCLFFYHGIILCVEGLNRF